MSKRSVEPGQIVQPGQPLMALIPLERVWITANFKETQLEHMRAGQRVTIEVDAYGGREFTGKVESVAPATGVALQPPAARQRHRQLREGRPARAGEIVLDDGQDPEHLLRPGMSVVPTVHTVRTNANPSRRPSGDVNPWLVAVAVMFATFMEVLDTTVVNVSLPHIASSLSATTEEATWALTSYLVANAIILPMTGWLASRRSGASAC